MAYGDGMTKLSPCPDETVLERLLVACPAPRALLDAGCGRGDRLAALQAALPGTDCRGVDIDPANALAACARCPDAEIISGDVCALPWADGSFDAALCECTLSLLDRPERCLSELARVLRPGGALLLSDLCTPEPSPARLSVAEEGAVRFLASVGWHAAAAEAAGFTVKRYWDCREEYLTMAAQLIFDCGGEGCCVSPAAFSALRAHRASYGMWIMERSGNE